MKRTPYRYLADGFLRWLSIARLLPLAGVGLATGAVATNLVLGLLPIGFMVGTSAMIERVSAVPAGAGSGMDTWQPPILAFAAAFGTLAVQNALSPSQVALGDLVTRRVDGRCTQRLMRASLGAPMELLERQDVVEKLSDARAGLVEKLVTPGAAVAGLLALVARYTQLVGAVALVAAVLGLAPGVIIGVTAYVARFGTRGSLRRWTLIVQRFQPARRRVRYVCDTGSNAAAAKEMRMLGILPWFTARADRESRSLLSAMWRQRRKVYLLPFLALMAVVLLGASVVMVQLHAAATDGTLSTFALALAIQGVLVLMMFGVFFPECDVQTQWGSAALENLTDLERHLSDADRSPLPGTAGSLAPGNAAVRFEAVHFSYPGSGRQVLSGLDLELAAGTSTAIVGLNGAGKTTLIKLLAGLYEPTAGRIVVGGVDLREVDPQRWRQQVAVVFQDYVRYELDAAANIGLGAPDRPRDHAALRAAADWAGATEILDALPAGLATPLSSRYAGGVDLSGGQWQRIALARAGYAMQGGASVLVLDEPTAQLDVRAEVAFFDRFLAVARGLTTIVVSHRFSTVRRADRIVVLEHGRIVESGSHVELLGRGGKYARLFALQANTFSGDRTASVEERS